MYHNRVLCHCSSSDVTHNESAWRIYRKHLEYLMWHLFVTMQLLMQQLSGVNSHLVDYMRNANEIHKYGIAFMLTHRGRATHICVSNLTINASDNGLTPGRRQANIWTSAGILLIGPLGKNFSEALVEIIIFSFKKIRLRVSSAKWQPSCHG